MIKKFIYSVLMLFVVLGVMACKKEGLVGFKPLNPDAQGIADTNRFVKLFERKYNGYALFRIPAMVKSKNGTLLAFAEGRMCGTCGDAGDINIVVKRSIDNGNTWSNMGVVWDDGDNTCGNPVPIVDQETGTIHLLMSWNNRRAFVTSSSDDGITWTKPVEITSSVKGIGWGWYATGPVHGIQISEGENKGRLLAPTYASVNINGVTKSYSFLIYSDDHGKTWQKGELTRQGDVGECTVAETNKGLLLNMRSAVANARVLATSTNGGISWSDAVIEPKLVDPQCQASMISFKQSNSWTLLQSNAASQTRTNMTIKMSEDGGANWDKSYTVFYGASAYSDMVLLDDQNIGLIFENGDKSPYDRIYFKRIPLKNIK
ncbi:exo-alpha-sialidase [Haoranjiania flava]|uniref:exo-alpha-sialidase n=1 Tax=Haoranjiania flava TaxID=1856322 RepID=A0AAE3ILH8_9BACT|nr:sialidase family protein [Haoranjiania flava]MCU7693874.1 glycoside hydrolase [Haoranjiania flava]